MQTLPPLKSQKTEGCETEVRYHGGTSLAPGGRKADRTHITVGASVIVAQHTTWSASPRRLGGRVQRLREATRFSLVHNAALVLPLLAFLSSQVEYPRRILTIHLLPFHRCQVEPLQELVGPLHELCTVNEIVRAVHDVIDTDQVPGTVEGAAVPPEGGIQIELLHILAGPTGNGLIAREKGRRIKPQVNTAGEIRQRATQVRQD